MKKLFHLNANGVTPVIIILIIVISLLAVVSFIAVKNKAILHNRNGGVADKGQIRMDTFGITNGGPYDIIQVDLTYNKQSNPILRSEERRGWKECACWCR